MRLAKVGVGCLAIVVLLASCTTASPLPEDATDQSVHEHVDNQSEAPKDTVPLPEEPAAEEVAEDEVGEQEQPQPPEEDAESADVPDDTVKAVPPVFVMPKSCTHQPDAGVCRGHFPMFYFDPLTKSCRQFIYGGCRGNENIYKTAYDCYAKCFPARLSGESLRQVSSTDSDYLTIDGGSNSFIFTFQGHHANMQVKDTALVDFSVSHAYQIQFYFRTDSPHGLIAFLRQTSVPEQLQGTRIQLYVYLKRGHLGITHIFGDSSESLLMQKGGVQEGNWHSGLVKINSATGQVILEVDAMQEVFTLASLQAAPHYHPNGTQFHGFTSRLWIGGVAPEHMGKEDVMGGLQHFHGCLKRVSLMSGASSSQMTKIRPLTSARTQDVKEDCISNCHDRFHNLCSPSSHCVEHFDHSTCNCYGSNKDGPRCLNPEVSVLSMSGDGYVVHRLYDWMDRVHSYTNLISIEFKSRFGNSILFYGFSKHPERQYLTATLTSAGTIYVEANLGGGSTGVEVGSTLTNENWQTFTLIHQHNKIQVHLNSRLHATLVLPGEVRYFHLEPDFYIGSAPGLNRVCGLPKDRGQEDKDEPCLKKGGTLRFYYDVPTASCLPFNYTGCGGNDNNFIDEATCLSSCYSAGLRSLNTFIGCMKNVYINDISVMYQLQQRNMSRYYGMAKAPPLDTHCHERQIVKLSLTMPNSHFNVSSPDPENFQLIISFRPSSAEGVLASGYVTILDTRSEWELRHNKHHVIFHVHDNLVHHKSTAKIEQNHWQYVELRYSKRLMVMRVNEKTESAKTPGHMIFSSAITIGKGLLNEHPGFVGCLRTLELSGQPVDLRTVVGTPQAHKDVIFDDCQVLSPCQRPGTCEHDAVCTMVGEEPQCNCTDTGYTGAKCSFSLYKRSCEQYRQLGYESSGVYRVDVDGNGPLQPSFVTCQFNDLTGQTTTVVEHNFPDYYAVRRPGLRDSSIKVQYRDFDDDMLKSLITQSKSCTQDMRYECRRSPLALSSHTWFSSPWKNLITSMGAKTSGLCRCKEINACDEPNVPCNCDVGDGLLRADRGTITDPEGLPITGMVFLQDTKGQREDSEGHVTLGPLKCIREAMESYVVSFSQRGSYLEVPAWREGSIMLSFRTTNKRALIAYQPAYHPGHANFSISLVDSRVVEFRYSFQGHEHHHNFTTRRYLNTGSWKQVLVEIHENQLRFVLESEEKLVTINRGAHLRELDGSMFLGGIPSMYAEDEAVRGLESMVGCIRGLTLNEQIVNLTRYLRAAPPGVKPTCKPSCDPNPCQNDGTCIESWGSYECVCSNPLAHSGNNCEHNINTEAITFTDEPAKIKYFNNDTNAPWQYNVLNSSFLINFRTHRREGLILFAFDYLHNFLQLHLASPDTIALLFNAHKDTHELLVSASQNVMFNGGQSVQVWVKRTSDATELIVFSGGMFFNASLDVGVTLLPDENYEQFPFGDSQPLPKMVYYPHSLTKPYPFYQVYLGSANENQLDVRSAVPGFVGCIRGLVIAGQPLSLLSLLPNTSSEDSNGAKANCMMACDQKPCLNGGTCTEDFTHFNNFRCDCSGTSYIGPICSSETAYTFHGRQWISRDSDVSPIASDFHFELAFSTSTTHSQPQIVALLRSTDVERKMDYVLVSVKVDGSIVVEAQLQDLDAEQVVGARVSPTEDGVNAFSGHRQYIVVERKGDQLTVMIDREERPVVPLGPVFVSETNVKVSPTGLYMGGVRAAIDDRLGHYSNFHGCISNVRLRTPDGESFPLDEYSENDLHLQQSGVPGFGSCAKFTPVGIPGVVLRAYGEVQNMTAVMGSEWVVRAAERVDFAYQPVASTHPERDTSMDNVVPAVAGTIVVVVLLIAAIIVVKSIRKKRKMKKKQQAKDAEERVPLYNGQARAPRVVQATYATVSEKASIPLKSAPQQAPSVGKAEEPELEVTKLVDVSLNQASAGQEEVQQRVREGEAGERPLSWDKATDNLPLTIGTTDDTTREDRHSLRSGECTCSESSSDVECTLEITSTPNSSPAVQKHADSEASPSSTRAQRGTISPQDSEASPSSTRAQKGTMLYIEEGMSTEPDESDSEPKLLRHAAVDPDEAITAEEQEEDVEKEQEAGEAMTEEDLAKRYMVMGQQQVQKIEMTDEEDEVVVVDVEDEGAVKKADSEDQDVKEDTETEMKGGKGEQEESTEQRGDDLKEKTDQKTDELQETDEAEKKLGDAKVTEEEAGQAKETEEPVEQKIDEPEEKVEATEEKVQEESSHTEEPVKENQPRDHDETTTPSDQEDDAPPPPVPASLPPPQDSSSDSSSDDEFIELRPERESVQEAQRMTSETLQQCDVQPPSQRLALHEEEQLPSLDRELENEKTEESEDKIQNYEDKEIPQNDEETAENNKEEATDKYRHENSSEVQNGDVEEVIGEHGEADSMPVPVIVVSYPEDDTQRAQGRETIHEDDAFDAAADQTTKGSKHQQGQPHNQDGNDAEGDEGNYQPAIMDDEQEKNAKEIPEDSGNHEDSKKKEANDNEKTISTDVERSLEEDSSSAEDCEKVDWSVMEQFPSYQHRDKNMEKQYLDTPPSEEEENEHPTYLNYTRDDDVCFNDSVTTKESVRSGSVTPLDPISEEDESDEEKATNANVHLPLMSPLIKNKFSGGRTHLNQINADSSDEETTEKEKTKKQGKEQERKLEPELETEGIEEQLKDSESNNEEKPPQQVEEDTHEDETKQDEIQKLLDEGIEKLLQEQEGNGKEHLQEEQEQVPDQSKEYTLTEERDHIQAGGKDKDQKLKEQDKKEEQQSQEVEDEGKVRLNDGQVKDEDQIQKKKEQIQKEKEQPQEVQQEEQIQLLGDDTDEVKEVLGNFKDEEKLQEEKEQDGKDEPQLKEKEENKELQDESSGGASSAPAVKKKKGRIIIGKTSPIYLSENVRTFNNPISYLGGPNIEYDDEGAAKNRTRNDSIGSITSVTSLD